MSDETKVQALLESRPSDNVRKGPKYLTQCARVWDPKHPAKTGLILPYHWMHTPEPSSSPTLQGHAARRPCRGLVLVAGQALRSEATRSFKAPNHPRSSNRGQDERRPSLIRTPLTKSYEKLLPIIHDLPGFKWPKPIRSNPSERNRNKRCDYRKDHGHTTEMCRSLHYMVEDLLKVGHLKQYIRTTPRGEGSSHGRGPRAPTAPVRAVINYIHREPLDDEYSSKRKRQRLLRAATVREHVSSIRPGLVDGSIHPIDGTIVFPVVDPPKCCNRIEMLSS
ncbi:hypothetical protein CK203_026716 [Vitis vinifera]|uniref:Uncharacterized protein n=1 Tax=Vitis vinifera TaxID=29760 RepID=A0A438ITY0_VITVI|nr:hypothetical protein CK203_026716 [Vitis vinifera]